MTIHKSRNLVRLSEKACNAWLNSSVDRETIIGVRVSLDMLHILIIWFHILTHKKKWASSNTRTLIFDEQRPHVRCTMQDLTYADVCWRMLTYADGMQVTACTLHYVRLERPADKPADITLHHARRERPPHIRPLAKIQSNIQHFPCHNDLTIKRSTCSWHALLAADVIYLLL